MATKLFASLDAISDKMNSQYEDFQQALDFVEDSRNDEIEFKLPIVSIYMYLLIPGLHDFCFFVFEYFNL